MRIEIGSNLKSRACLNIDYIFAASKKKKKEKQSEVNEKRKITPLLSVLFKWKIYNRFDSSQTGIHDRNSEIDSEESRVFRQ